MSQTSRTCLLIHIRALLNTHRTLLGANLKRSSYSMVSCSNEQLSQREPLYNQRDCARLYSTRTAKASMNADHKSGLPGFVYNLSVEERDELLQLLTKASKTSNLPAQVPIPTKSELRYVAFFSGVPFIGFGLLDNTIMLTAGEYIDITFGTWLGITTMAAAALGNMISDVLGITTAGFVEQTALKFGLKAPTVTLEQLSLRQCRWMANLGRCIGVCIGCLLGMWPLLVFSKEKSAENDKEE